LPPSVSWCPLTPLPGHGIAGRGETIVMPEFVSTASTPGLTDVRADLARFDSLFGLPPANLEVITSFAGASTPYLASGEEARSGSSCSRKRT
jgi:hypothetical protein